MNNKNILLIVGKPASGKSTSLRNVEDASRVAYLNYDGKELPFQAATLFQTVEIQDSADTIPFLQNIEDAEGVDLGVIDTLTYAMDKYESQYVLTSKNTQKAWGDYGQFYKQMMETIKNGSKDYVIYAHSKDIYNESELVMETKVPVKGAVGHRGVESDFTIILGAKCIPLSKLEGFENKYLNITDEEREDGFKYVFVTRVTKDATGEKMRSPMGLWARNELYIDNDVAMVLRRVKEYYGG